jgi:hypothetical protein
MLHIVVIRASWYVKWKLDLLAKTLSKWQTWEKLVFMFFCPIIGYNRRRFLTKKTMFSWLPRLIYGLTRKSKTCLKISDYYPSLVHTLSLSLSLSLTHTHTHTWHIYVCMHLKTSRWKSRVSQSYKLMCSCDCCSWKKMKH